jgi:hypothetical protein
MNANARAKQARAKVLSCSFGEYFYTKITLLLDQIERLSRSFLSLLENVYPTLWARPALAVQTGGFKRKLN